MAHTDIAPGPLAHDGSTGNVLQRAEPKVRVAGLVALLTPVLAFYALKAVPAIAGLPGLADWADMLIATGLTGVLTFLAAFLAKPIDRIDLFAQNTKKEVEQAVEHAVGPEWAQRLEDWLHDLHLQLTSAAKPALVSLEHAAQTIAADAAAGTDPLVAARAAEPGVIAAVRDAAAQVQAQAQAEAEALKAKAEVTISQDPVQALAALLAQGGTVDTHALLSVVHKALSLLEPAAPDAATPIAEEARAAVPAAQLELPAVPTTVPMPAVDPNPATTEIPAQGTPQVP